MPDKNIGRTAIDLERFRRDLDLRRRQLGATWNALAGMSGVSPAMFTRINSGSSVSLEAFAQLCAACGLEPGDYMPDVDGRAWRRAGTALRRYAGIDVREAQRIIGIAKADAAVEPPRTGRIAKESQMESKTLSIEGRQFSIDDVDMRRRAAWANGPAILDADLPDGTTLGSVMETDGRWLWHLRGEDWNAPEPVEGNLSRYIDQGGREAAIVSLLNAIEDRYSEQGRDDPWREIAEAQAEGPAEPHDKTVGDTAGYGTSEPWPPADPWEASAMEAAGSALPMPDPGMAAPATPGAAGPGMAI